MEKVDVDLFAPEPAQTRTAGSVHLITAEAAPPAAASAARSHFARDDNLIA
jgi:hypothetical protein